MYTLINGGLPVAVIDESLPLILCRYAPLSFELCVCRVTGGILAGECAVEAILLR